MTRHNISSNAAANVLPGLAGNDTLIDGDRIDNLAGGLDADTFYFNALSDDVDSSGIVDFEILLMGIA